MAKLSYTVKSGATTKTVSTNASTIAEGQKKISAAYGVPNRNITLKAK
jgi:hypothetical protein